MTYPNLKGDDVIFSGYNDDIDAAAAETIWPNGTIFTWPTQARSIGLISTSAADDADGTGARTVNIEGIGADGKYLEEEVAMDGTTDSFTDQNFLAVNRAYVTSAGSGGKNAGTITLVAAIDTTVQGVILPGVNQTQQCALMVPNDRDFLLKSYFGAVIDVDSNLRVDLIANIGGIFRTEHIIAGKLTGSTMVQKVFPNGMKIPAGSQIRLDASVSTDETKVAGGFEGDWVS